MSYPIAIRKDAERDWCECVKNNSKDAYSKATLDFAIRWAQLMEERIEMTDDPVRVINERAEELSHEANTEGITGCMYTCALSILAHAWEHGKILRAWHNSRYGYVGDGVVNPAILTVEVPDD